MTGVQTCALPISSVITLNGTGILIALFVLMMLLGMMMIFSKK